MRKLILVSTVLIMLAGCADGGGGSTGGDALIGRSFLSESVSRDGTTVALVDGTRILMHFSDRGVGAEAGCNLLFADMSIRRGRLEVSDAGWTDMGCTPERHEQDRWLIEFLEGSPRWTIEGDRLTLTSGDTELVLLDRRFADPDTPLAGLRWVVDGVVRGDTTSAMVEGTEGSAWLVIDGTTYRASSGCRDYEGEVALVEIDGRMPGSAGQLEFRTDVPLAPVCPAESRDVDWAMRVIVTGQVDFVIEAERLTLRHPEGRGLDLSSDR